VTYLPETAAGGEVSGVYALVHDITAQKETEANLRQLAQFDHLTGLPNRSRFHDALAEAIARSERSGELMAVVYLDIDRFKAINDRFGHQQGDAVLREFGARLLRSVRRTDTVAGLAGDEFVVILESLHSGDEACDVARKILLAIGVPFAFDGTTQSVGTSIGIALRHAGETDPEALLHRADEALYAAKAAGRGRFSLAAATPIST
jgi:diguanylate cyclase (GGDEF)-like protein